MREYGIDLGGNGYIYYSFDLFCTIAVRLSFFVESISCASLAHLSGYWYRYNL